MEYSEECLEKYLPMAHSIARSIEWSTDDHDDLVQEGLLALLKSMREYAARQVPVRNPEGLASWVMVGWMKYWYKPLERKVYFTEWRDEYSGWCEDDEVVYIKEFYDALEHKYGVRALAVAKALVSPDAEVGAVVLEVMATKAALAAAGYSVKGHRSPRLSHEVVRRSLGMEEPEWYKTLEQVRTFTRSYLTRTS